MWLKWMPWKLALSQVARSHGFLDPVALLGRLHRFAQPSEVAEPVELLRAGVSFHARGLINSRVIQHNLDWVWPYWVERQFDPRDASFVPRAFSITHVNLTHRNWTAVGLPDTTQWPIIDPRGLLTPHFDGWSLDAWVVRDDGWHLLPSQLADVGQRLDLTDNLAVETSASVNGTHLHSRVDVQRGDDGPSCRLQVQATSEVPGWLVLTLRPYNPEGISFIHDVELEPNRTAWVIDGHRRVELSLPAERHHVSRYVDGDVRLHLLEQDDLNAIECDVGMATAAAMYRIEANGTVEIEADIALDAARSEVASDWSTCVRGTCELKLPGGRIQPLWDAAVRTLLLHTPHDVYAGPYTYKRFWFRDAALVLNGLLATGDFDRCERAIGRFFSRQDRSGYFHSQEGEWDANGEVLWVIERYCALSGRPPSPEWQDAIYRGARWIGKKRLSDLANKPHAGLLPAGFSAEHLGPNDYYYWDDFWASAGLAAAAGLAQAYGDLSIKAEFLAEQMSLDAAIECSLATVERRLGRAVIPASPYRRMDAGAIGSIVASYPLGLCSANDERMRATTGFLLENCFVKDAFFQDMIHSGLNAYLTLHVAQVLLRAGDSRHHDLLRAVAALASPTGQWPEAVHPATGGGCMGDGQHVWAAAEWLMAVRNCLVREEGHALIIGSGIAPEWLQTDEPLQFGPAPTRAGSLNLSFELQASGDLELHWDATWHDGEPSIDVRVPGFAPEVVTTPGTTGSVLLNEATQQAT